MMSLKGLPLYVRVLGYLGAILFLPVNVLYRVYRFVWQVIADSFRERPTPETHLRKRRAVEEQVRQWNLGGRQRKMCTGRKKIESVMVKLPKYRDTLHKIDVADLRDILSIDVEKKVVNVEPMIKIVDLIDALLALGWTLPIVPEGEWCTIDKCLHTHMFALCYYIVASAVLGAI